MKFTEQEIEEILENSIRELPPEFKKALDNVIICVEDLPPRRKLPKKGIGRSSLLLGLYHGVPKTHRSRRHGPIMPDYISIYRKSIEKLARNKDQAKELLRTTLLHEIGHHLGLSEFDLRKRGY